MSDTTPHISSFAPHCDECPLRLTSESDSTPGGNWPACRYSSPTSGSLLHVCQHFRQQGLRILLSDQALTCISYHPAKRNKAFVAISQTISCCSWVMEMLWRKFGVDKPLVVGYLGIGNLLN